MASSHAMADLLSAEYIPFGSQYYRAPSPHASEWEKDLKNMAALGFNTVKFWIQWRWNEPSLGRYEFSDIDRLMELAHACHLRVMLNTIVDVAPAWIYRKYPDASMVTLDGRRVGPQTQPHRQIGGLGVCFNHARVMEHLFGFLKAAVRRYSAHPALEMWNVASEPELTSSMAELRLYADDAAQMGDMLCYCAHCQRAFKKWLGKKYGSIAALNHSWNRNYQSFAEVEVPKTRNTFNDLVDWRMFFVETLGEHVRRRFDVARKEDKGRHALLCHHVFIQGFPVTSTASDPWNVGRFGDLHGFTQMDDPMMSDILRSCAKGKPVISAEMLMLYGYTLDLPRPIDRHDIMRSIFTGVAANQKGFIFWQYRPETLGREAPAWGLTQLDGYPTPWLKEFAAVNAVVQKNARFLLKAEPPKADLAILFDPENQVFAWASTGAEKTATDSLLGLHRALYEKSFRIDFLHPREIRDGVLAHYRVLFLPFPYHMRKGVCEKIARWVEEGGVLVSEAYTAAWDPEEGMHSTVIPGQGLDAVFGAREDTVAPAFSADGSIECVLESDLPFIKKGESFFGRLVKEALVPVGADVLARFTTGEPAMTRHTYGKGQAILIGTYVGLGVQREKRSENARLLSSFAEMALPLTHPTVEDGRLLRIDTLATREGEEMVIIRNMEEDAVHGASVTLPGRSTRKLTEQFTGEKLECIAGTLCVSLEAREVKVYCS